MKPTTIGALWIIGGMSLIAFADNFVAGIAADIGLWQFHFIRSAMVLPLAVLVAVLVTKLTGQRGTLFPHAPVAVMQRSLFGTVGLLMYFAALPSVGIAQAAGFFTSPIWVAVFSVLFFGERVGPRRIVGVVLGFAGVCLVLGVGAAPVKPMALISVGGAAAWAMNVIWTRQYCLRESPVCLAVWQFGALLLAGLAGLTLAPWLGGMLAGVPGAEFASQSWRPLGLATTGTVFLTGLAGIVATGCIAWGYMAGASSIMGVFDFSFLFWAPFFAWLVWGDVVSGRIGLGMALIVAAGVLAIWSGARAREPGHG